MLKRALTVVGKSLLIVTGVGYGVVKAMDVLAEDAIREAQGESEADDVPKSTPPQNAVPDDTTRRFHGMDERLIRIEKGLACLNVPRPAEQNFVTHADLKAAMEQALRRLDADMDRRFEVQDRSVQSLRTMIARTDELLEQVIENIESMRLSA